MDYFSIFINLILLTYSVLILAALCSAKRREDELDSRYIEMMNHLPPEQRAKIEIQEARDLEELRSWQKDKSAHTVPFLFIIFISCLIYNLL